MSSIVETTNTEEYTHEYFINQLYNIFPEFMVLYVYVDPSNNILQSMYKNAINQHNNKLFTTAENPDSGFDLFATELEDYQSQDFPYGVYDGSVKKINFGIKCAAKLHRQPVGPYENIEQYRSVTNTGYYMYPRSSLSKTELRLANSVGIIDSGYRGNLMGVFDKLPPNERYSILATSYVSRGDRVVQICAPALQPIYVIMVDSVEQLGTTTRGQGGFGSTGR
jgi:hypothetical protein